MFTLKSRVDVPRSLCYVHSSVPYAFNVHLKIRFSWATSSKKITVVSIIRARVKTSLVMLLGAESTRGTFHPSLQSSPVCRPTTCTISGFRGMMVRLPSFTTGFAPTSTSLCRRLGATMSLAAAEAALPSPPFRLPPVALEYDPSRVEQSISKLMNSGDNRLDLWPIRVEESESAEASVRAFGFDLEWKPTGPLFGGDGQPALLQVCMGVNNTGGVPILA